jgi:hypothetical protein
VTKPAGNALRSSIVADPIGLLHLAYRGLNLDASAQAAQSPIEALRNSVARVGQADRVTAWSPGTPFSRHTPTYFPDIAIDSRGVLHLTWTENDGGSAYGIYYAHSIDGGATWSLATPLEKLNPVYYYRAQLKVGLADELHIVWELVTPADAEVWAPVPIGFVYARSTDGGESWSQTVFLAKPEAQSPRRSVALGGLWPLQPAVGVDGQGRILLIWRDNKSNVIYYQRSSDGALWSPPLPVPGIARGIFRPFDRYDMVTDAAGHVHLVGVGYPTGSTTLTLWHSEWTGNEWLPADAIVSAPPYPEWPRIATSEGNRLHVVWFDGDSDTTGRVPIGIRYSTARSSAGWLAPAPPPAESEATLPFSRDGQTPKAKPTAPATVRPQPLAALPADSLNAPPASLDSNRPFGVALAVTALVLFFAVMARFVARALNRQKGA